MIFWLHPKALQGIFVQCFFLKASGASPSEFSCFGCCLCAAVVVLYGLSVGDLGVRFGGCKV